MYPSQSRPAARAHRTEAATLMPRRSLSIETGISPASEMRAAFRELRTRMPWERRRRPIPAALM